MEEAAWRRNEKLGMQEQFRKGPRQERNDLSKNERPHQARNSHVKDRRSLYEEESTLLGQELPLRTQRLASREKSDYVKISRKSLNMSHSLETHFKLGTKSASQEGPGGQAIFTEDGHLVLGSVSAQAGEEMWLLL